MWRIIISVSYGVPTKSVDLFTKYKGLLRETCPVHRAGGKLFLLFYHFLRRSKGKGQSFRGKEERYEKSTEARHLFVGRSDVNRKDDVDVASLLLLELTMTRGELGRKRLRFNRSAAGNQRVSQRE